MAITTIIGVPQSFIWVPLGCLMTSFWFTVIVISIAQLIGEVFCFLIARHLLKQYFIAFLQDLKYYNALNKTSKDQPFTICILIRCCYMPGFIKSYILPLSSIEFWHYIVSALIIGPLYIAWGVFIGSQCHLLGLNDSKSKN